MDFNFQPEIEKDKAIYTVNDFNLKTYEDVISARTLPIYEVVGNKIIFPASYVEGFNNEKVTLPLPLTEELFDYQKVIVKVSFLKERYGIFLNQGLGKTFAIGELARQIHNSLTGKIIICVPLNVMRQFEEMVKEFFPDFPEFDHLHRKSIEEWCKNSNGKRVAFINHEAFIRYRELTNVDAFLLDESAILRGGIGGNGKISTNIIKCTKGIRYKFAASGTPSPNDRVEYAMHALFLEIVRSEKEFYSLFFVNKDNDYVLRRHAEETFYRYLSHFSIFMRQPKAYGFEDNLAGLKPWQEIYEKVDMTEEQMNYINHRTGHKVSLMNDLIIKPKGMNDRIKFSQISKGFVYSGQNRKITYIDSNKPKKIVDIVNSHKPEQIIIWTVFDTEGDILDKELSKQGYKVVHITGATKEDDRIKYIEQFRHGELDIIISKPRILGFGLNFQFCRIAIFSGLRDSYEEYIQALKRIHRYGQENQVLIYLVFTPYEEAILKNVLNKQEEMTKDFEYQEKLYIKSLFEELQEFLQTDNYVPEKKQRIEMEPIKTDTYQLYHGDSIKMMMEILDGKEYGWLKKNSVDLSVFSPPFMGDVFTYTSDPADMGNTRGAGAQSGADEFMLQFHYFLKGMLTITKPGRIMAMHLEDVPLRKGLDGHVGIYDFVGRAIQEANKAGWILFGKIPILKNQQAQSIIKHISSLSMSNMETDRTRISPANNGYLCLFKKPGENQVEISDLARCNNCGWQGYAKELENYNSDYLREYKNYFSTGDYNFICPNCANKDVKIYSEMNGDKWIIYAEGVWPENGFNRDYERLSKIPQTERWLSLVQTALGVWFDINESDIIRTGLGNNEEEDADKHLCPLPKTIARRAIELYSMPDELILSPFAGIGTEGVEAVKAHRRFCGIELKPEYFVSANNNIERVISRSEVIKLF